ncbi:MULTISPECIES: hypothetical protein [Lysinibacillus]|uniref:Uncharacterized protein n=1 Tax=Lysinibacillus irui TaxID=2998077 RepID=A0AAJ5URL8_9BACI|nr:MULTISPECIES: hypothetical protein [Lysinibacillus]WDV05064.1 hypothetical protein OU989_12125 [Lysinibacillus irui]
MKSSKFEFPTKKDMTYWILIIVVLLVCVSVWKTEDSASLAGDLSLGGTLLSIFLAIIAIIFSFIQSSDANSHNKEMIGKMDSLTNSLKYLNDLNNEKNQEIEQKNSDLNELKSMITEIADEVKKGGQQAQNDQLDNNKWAMLVRKIEETQKNVSSSNLGVQITVSGPRALYNFLLKHFQKDEYVPLKTLRTMLKETYNLNNNSDELLEDLETLQNENKITISNKSKDEAFIQIK